MAEPSLIPVDDLPFFDDGSSKPEDTSAFPVHGPPVEPEEEQEPVSPPTLGELPAPDVTQEERAQMRRQVQAGQYAPAYDAEDIPNFEDRLPGGDRLSQAIASGAEAISNSDFEFEEEDEEFTGRGEGISFDDFEGEDSTPAVLAQIADEKIAQNRTLSRNEFNAREDREDARGWWDKTTSFFGAIPEGFTNMATDLAVAGLGAADTIGLPDLMGDLLPGELGENVRLAGKVARKDFNKRTTLNEAANTGAEAIGQSLINLNLMTQDIYDYAKHAAAAAPLVGMSPSERRELKFRMVNEAIERRAAVTPGDGESLVGAYEAVIAGGGDSALMAEIQEDAAARINGDMLHGMQVAADVAMTGPAFGVAGLGVRAGVKTVGKARKALSGSRIVKPSVPSQAITRAMDGPKSARASQKFDGVLRDTFAKVDDWVERGGAGELMRKGATKVGTTARLGGIGGALFSPAISGPMGVGIALAGGPAARLGAFLTAPLVNVGVKYGYQAAKWSGRMAKGTADGFAKASKLKLEYGFGAPNAKVWGAMARDSSLPNWVRRTAGEAEYLATNWHTHFITNSTWRAIVEGGEEGLQTYATLTSTPEQVGQAVGAGAAAGGIITAGMGPRNVDKHLGDLDAVDFRRRMVEHGDSPELFDALPAQARRDVAAVQGAFVDTPIRLMNGSDFAQATGNPSARQLAEGAYLSSNNELLLNMDLVGNDPKRLLSTLSHEAGHAAYATLPTEVKQQWRDTAHFVYGEKVVEKFRQDYNRALGVADPTQGITTDVALDEMWAEQFLGVSGVGQKLLKNKRSMNALPVPGLRRLRYVTDAVRKKLGMDGSDPEGLLSFTPYKDAPELDAMIRESLQEKMRPLPNIPMPTKNEAKRRQPSEGTFTTPEPEAAPKPKGRRGRPKKSAEQAAKDAQAAEVELREAESALNDDSSPEERKAVTKARANAKRLREAAEAAATREAKEATRTAEQESDNLSEEASQVLSDSMDAETVTPVDLPNGKQVIPLGNNDDGTVSYVDADELTHALQEVESTAHTDASKLNAAVAYGKKLHNLARAKRHTLYHNTPERADLHDLGITRDNSGLVEEFLGEVESALEPLIRKADPKQFEGGTTQYSPRRDLPNKQPGLLVSESRRKTPEVQPTDDGSAEAFSEREERATKESQVAALKKVMPSPSPEVRQRARMAADSDINGAEHEVHIDPDSRRVVKVWRQWNEGGDTPYQYLDRLEYQNRFLDDEIRVEGIDDTSGIITSQPLRVAKDPNFPHPTVEEIKDYMAGKGFWQLSDENSYSNGQVVVGDARPANFINTPEGPRMVDGLWSEEGRDLEQDLETEDDFEVDDVDTTERFDDDPFGEDLFFRPVDFGEVATTLENLVRDNPEGFTFNLGGEAPTSGYVVAPSKATEFFVTPDNLNEDSLTDYFERNADVFERDGVHLGGWYDSETGRYVLDGVFVLGNRDDASRIAVLGDQDAIFHLDTFTEIRTKDAKTKQPILPEGDTRDLEQLLREGADVDLVSLAEEIGRNEAAVGSPDGTADTLGTGDGTTTDPGLGASFRPRDTDDGGGLTQGDVDADGSTRGTGRGGSAEASFRDRRGPGSGEFDRLRIVREDFPDNIRKLQEATVERIWDDVGPGTPHFRRTVTGEPDLMPMVHFGPANLEGGAFDPARHGRKIFGLTGLAGRTARRTMGKEGERQNDYPVIYPGRTYWGDAAYAAHPEPIVAGAPDSSGRPGRARYDTFVDMDRVWTPQKDPELVKYAKQVAREEDGTPMTFMTYLEAAVEAAGYYGYYVDNMQAGAFFHPMVPPPGNPDIRSPFDPQGEIVPKDPDLFFRPVDPNLPAPKASDDPTIFDAPLPTDPFTDAEKRAGQSDMVFPAVTTDPANELLTDAPEENRVGIDKLKALYERSTGAEHRKMDTFVKRMATLVRDSPGFRDVGPKTIETAEQAFKVMEEVRDRMVDNLLSIYDAVPPPLRSHWERWYPLARKWNGAVGARIGVPHWVIAGVNARLSPGKDWIHNVNMTDRLVSAVENDIQIDDQMVKALVDVYAAAAIDKLKVPQRTPENIKKISDAAKERAKIISDHVGKKLSEVDDETAGIAARAWTQAHGDNRVINYFSPGKEVYASGISWQAEDNLTKAINMLRNPTKENIDRLLGDKAHKIRSFTNNQVSPNDMYFQDVTMDTHATAATHIMPLGQQSTEVTRNFGGAKNKYSGIYGTYPIQADAYRIAAQRRGVQPRAMQSVTWEGLRAMFPAAYKRNKKVLKTTREIWQQVEQNKISRSDALQKINRLFLEWIEKNPKSRPDHLILLR